MKKILYLMLVITLGCSTPKSAEAPVSEPVTDSTSNTSQNILTTKSSDSLTFTIIDGANGTFGYDILKDGKVYIHQPHLPGMSGNLGFAKQTQAAKAANLMIEKLRKNIAPPTITVEELKVILAE